MARILDFADGFESSVAPAASGVAGSTIVNVPSGNMSATTVQGAINELQGDIDTINASVGAPSGIASLDSGGKIPTAQMPALALVDVYVVANIAARDALTVQEGDVAKVTSGTSGTPESYIYDGSTWVMLNTDAQLTAHIVDTTDAHAASAITNTPSGNLAATTVQSALNELQTDVDTRATTSALSTHTSASTGVHGVSGSVVGTSDAQTLTNKDIDGGTASNTRRITLPKDTKGSLDSLTRKAGTVVYGTDTLKAYIDNGTSLVAIGSGSGSGGLNYITNPDIETDLTGYTVYTDGFQIASNAFSTTEFAMYGTHLPKLSVGDALLVYSRTGGTDIALNSTVYVKTIVNLAFDIYELSTTLGGSAIVRTAAYGYGMARVTPTDGARTTDGNGAAPTVTLTRSTASPLASTASAVFTKPASNTAGQGFSFDFTIDAAYRGQQLSIGYLSQLVSGTYSNDMTCWIRDLTNGVNIQPSAFQVQPTSLGGPAQPLVFQTASDSTSYRLIFRCATASTSAYTLKFDNFSVGPQVVPMGAPVTDWTAFTPTGSWTTNTTYTGQWRRVGDTAEYRLKALLAGAPTATSLNLNLASGHTVDVAKLAQTTAGTGTLGRATILDAGVAAYSGFVQYGSTTSVNVYVGNAGGTYTVDNNVTHTVPIAFGASDAVDVQFSVPIVGWSSNTVVSDSAATRDVAARYAAVGGQSIATSSFVIMDYATKTTDTHGKVTTGSSWKFTSPTVGNFNVTATATFTAFSSAASSVFLSIYKNGVVYSQGPITTTQAIGQNWAASVSDQVPMVPGDYIDIRVFQNTAGAQTIVANPAASTVAISQNQGPAQIQAATNVIARYTGTPTGTLNGSLNIATFPTKQIDTHGAYSGGNYVVPAPGPYEISVIVDIQGTVSANQYFGVYIYKNGVQIPGAGAGPYLAGGLAGTTTFLPNVIVDLVQGDIITVRTITTVASPTYQAFSSFSIRRLNGVN